MAEKEESIIFRTEEGSNNNRLLLRRSPEKTGRTRGRKGKILPLQGMSNP